MLRHGGSGSVTVTRAGWSIVTLLETNSNYVMDITCTGWANSPSSNEIILTDLYKTNKLH